VRNAAIGAGIGAVVLSFAVGPWFAVVHLTAVGAAMAYNAGLKRRPFSVLPYAVAFGLLPVAVAVGLPRPHLAPAWAIAAGALIGSGGHFTQALPDIEADRRLGVLGLPQRVGPTGSGLAAAGLLGAATLLALLGPGVQGRPGLALVAGAAVSVGLSGAIAAAAVSGRARLAFRLTLGTAAVAVVAFLVSGARL
jgi:4-hydroxybenzoate polyprenyltransferase